MKDNSEFENYLNKFTGLFGEFSEWVPTEARKKHKDEFDNVVECGEIYYKREYGSAYHEVLKLSKKSLEIIFRTIFWSNPVLKNIGEHLANEKEKKSMEAMREAVNKFSVNHKSNKK